MTQTPALKTQQMQVGGMDCTGCKLKIEGSLERLPGVTEAAVTVATGRLVVSYDPEQVSEITIKERVKSLGYTIGVEQAPAARTATQAHEHHHDRTQGHRHEDGHRHADHDEAEGHDHGHSHGSGEFNLKAELLPVLGVVTLLVLGMVFETPLHDTPYSLGEYAVFPACLSHQRLDGVEVGWTQHSQGTGV